MTSGYLAEQLYPLPTQREPKNVVPTQSKIGFLGLGIMGSALVSNLLSSGHDVTVWNRTPSKVRCSVRVVTMLTCNRAFI